MPFTKHTGCLGAGTSHLQSMGCVQPSQTTHPMLWALWHHLLPQPQCTQHGTKRNSATGQLYSQLCFQDSSLFAEDLTKSCKELNIPYKKVLVENKGMALCSVPRALPEGASGNPALLQMDRAGLGPLWLTDKYK